MVIERQNCTLGFVIRPWHLQVGCDNTWPELKKAHLSLYIVMLESRGDWTRNLLFANPELYLLRHNFGIEWQMFFFSGMSGSCSVRVCWRKLPSFRVTGTELFELHEGAALMKLAQKPLKRFSKLKPARSELKRPNKTELVYLEDSPDYCERNLT